MSAETREVFVICDESGRIATQSFYATRLEADTLRSQWAAGHYYHVRPARLTIEVLGSPPESWLTVVNSSGAHRV